jgi:predicted PurR-regulated permease PerM
VWQGVVVLAVGAVVISLVDNILRPILVAKDTAMSDVLVLLSVVGGLSLFGIAGIIIGPVITAFFLSMWQLFEHDYAGELRKHG